LNLFSSVKNFFRINQLDKDFTRLGAQRGWYLRTYYQGRFDTRFRPHDAPRKATVSLTVAGRVNRVALTAVHLGAFTGVFVDQEYDLLPHLPEDLPNPRIADLGANVGFAACYFSSLFPGAQIMCCEPDPRNIAMLRETIDANALNAKIVEAAVASKAGRLRLRIGANPTCSSLESTEMHDLKDSIEVDLVTVPQIMERAGWDQIDILKIDIEGSEKELLESNNAWLEHVRYIVLEIHPNTSEEEIAGFLKPFGFDLRRIGFATEPVYFASRRTRDAS
jgi:FkbM family methyltransferase